MRLYKLTILLTWLVAGLCHNASAQVLDSLLSERKSRLQEYTQFRSNMTERTWINLIDLHELADQLINADNDLIGNHLEEEIARNKEIKTLNDQAAMEIAYLKKETEQSNIQLNEHSALNSMLMMIILGLSAALLMLIIALISLYRKNKEIFHELQRLWSMNDEHSILLKEKEQMLNKQLRLLEIENTAMQKEMDELAIQKNHLKLKQEESTTRGQEDNKQIRNLRDQIKKKSG